MPRTKKYGCGMGFVITPTSASLALDGEDGFDPTYIAIVEKVCQQINPSYKKLAEVFGISVIRLREWRRNYPEFETAIICGKDSYMAPRVEDTLIRKALGYEYTETKEVAIFLEGPDGKLGTEPYFERTIGGGIKQLVKGIKRTIYKRHRTPDAVALFFYLTNRRPERWKHASTQLVEDNNKPVLSKESPNLNNLSRRQLEQLEDLIRESIATPIAINV